MLPLLEKVIYSKSWAKVQSLFTLHTFCGLRIVKLFFVVARFYVFKYAAVFYRCSLCLCQYCTSRVCVHYTILFLS